MEAIELTIDGQPVAVAPGITVLEAAQQAGIYIPNLCHHPDLKPYGGCRLCVVEIEGVRGLTTSCSTPATPGMVVHTDTSLVESGRRTVVEMILARHPTPCLVCRKNQTCPLRQAAAYLGAAGDLLSPVYRSLPVDDSHSLFYLDPNRCCFCARCVRTCEEIRGLTAITFIGRGYDGTIGVFDGQLVVDSTCDSCLECVKRCPVNALMPTEAGRAILETGVVVSAAAPAGMGAPA